MEKQLELRIGDICLLLLSKCQESVHSAIRTRKEEQTRMLADIMQPRSRHTWTPWTGQSCLEENRTSTMVQVLRRRKPRLAITVSKIRTHLARLSVVSKGKRSAQMVRDLLRDTHQWMQVEIKRTQSECQTFRAVDLRCRTMHLKTSYHPYPRSKASRWSLSATKRSKASKWLDSNTSLKTLSSRNSSSNNGRRRMTVKYRRMGLNTGRWTTIKFHLN